MVGIEKSDVEDGRDGGQWGGGDSHFENGNERLGITPIFHFKCVQFQQRTRFYVCIV